MSKASELADSLMGWGNGLCDVEEAAALLLEQEKALREAERLLISGHVDAAIATIQKVLSQ